MRKSTDNCLLCGVNEASQTNSHIFPRFLTKSLFGNPKKGYSLSSDKPIPSKIRPLQDSPKEDHILCSACESYFGILERLSSHSLNNWREKVKRGEFRLTQFSQDFGIVELSTADKNSITLMLYSLFWRASISKNPLFQSIKVQPDFEEDLRQTLLAHRATKERGYKASTSQKPLTKIFPTSIITAASFEDTTSNILNVPFFNGAYRLIINQFCFLLFYSVDSIAEGLELFKVGGNTKDGDGRMIVFSESFWKDNVTRPVIGRFAKAVKKN